MKYFLVKLIVKVKRLGERNGKSSIFYIIYWCEMVIWSDFVCCCVIRVEVMIGVCYSLFFG